MSFKTGKTIEEQKAAISRIMQDDSVPYYRFKFGKYKGFTLAYVVKENKNYLKWLYNNDVDLPSEVESYISSEIS